MRAARRFALAALIALAAAALTLAALLGVPIPQGAPAGALGCASAQAQEATGAASEPLGAEETPGAGVAEGPATGGNRGSIWLTMTCDDAAVAGGSLALYQVAAPVPDGGGFRFELTQAFVASGAVLDAASVADPQTARTLASYASEHGLAGDVRTVGADGMLVYDDLALGLYLLVQVQPATGFLGVEPFLVSVPLLKNGAYRYDVDATPKVSVEKAPGPVEPPVPPAGPDDGRLPQTGQLAWPIPVLAAAGLVLFATGWVLRGSRGQEGVRAHGGKR